MVIINLEQCLSQLNDEVKQKIILRQNEVVQNESRTNLHERLYDAEFRKKLLANVSEMEKKYLKTMIMKYSYYVKNSSVEEQIVSIEEKLALLLLRQVGFIYKLDEKKHKQQFIIPIEFVESFFDLTFERENGNHFFRGSSLKHYLYYLFELIFFIKEKANQSVLDFELLHQRFSNRVSWDLLLKFLINERLIIDSKNMLTVNDQTCKQFFEKPNKEMKRQLSYFILWEFLGDPFAVHFIMWVLSNENGMKRKVLLEYLKKHGQVSEVIINQAFEQLSLLDILGSSDEDVIYVKIDDDSSDIVHGMEAGMLEFLIPVTIPNAVLWNFRSWGSFIQWDVMIHIAITQETVRRALREASHVSDITNHLKTYLSESIIGRWQETFQQWLEEGKPILKKDQLVFYSISEKLHLKFIEEHWGAWWEKTCNGIVIEHQLVVKFEKLLRKLSLNTFTPKKEVGYTEPLFHFVLINEFPSVITAVPELDNIPKQWFILTGYDERTTQRIVKQTIVLRLRLQIENKNKEILNILPQQMTNVNGSYVIFTKEKIKIKMTEISKVAIIHPLKNEM